MNFMRYKPKHYAEALCDILDSADKDRLNDILEGFIELVAENGDIGRMDEIVDIFGEEFDRREGVVKAKVFSSHVIDRDMISVLKEHVASRTDALHVDIDQEIDEDVLGGMILSYGDKIMDASLRKDIKEMGERIRS